MPWTHVTFHQWQATLLWWVKQWWHKSFTQVTAQEVSSTLRGSILTWPKAGSKFLSTNAGRAAAVEWLPASALCQRITTIYCIPCKNFVLVLNLISQGHTRRPVWNADLGPISRDSISVLLYIFHKGPRWFWCWQFTFHILRKKCFSILTLNEVTYFSRGERLVKLMKWHYSLSIL